MLTKQTALTEKSAVVNGAEIRPTCTTTDRLAAGRKGIPT
jgi:hypothetical protein